MAINLSNVNISLNEFHRLSHGEYNAGEVKLAGETKLAKMNNHVGSFFANNEIISRQEWESIKDMTEGEFKKTITETVFSDTPTERTITYKAPFFRKDREADYKEAWEMLEKRFKRR